MRLNRLLTIGYANRTVEEFISLLSKHRISAVADVRSQPYSRRHPWFNAESIKAELRNANVAYVYLGNELGARLREQECYVAGRVNYDLIAKTDAFRSGLDRLRQGLRSSSIAIMCAEKDPVTCHRMILICRHLKSECEISHIIEANHVETHSQAESRLLESVGLPSRDLFQTTDELLAQAYEMQGKRMAFQAATATAQNE